jgi:hypothetical protein
LKLKRKRKKEQFKMFAKNKVSQSMIDAVNSVISEGKVEEASEKVPTPTGMKVYGSSYGNSKKARADQTKHSVDDVKGPKDKEMKEELKGNQHKIDKNKNNKIDAHDFKILRGEKKVSEESEKEDSCEDEAKQEVKKHEKKLHGKKGEVSKHVAKLHKENVFYRFAKELQENKTAGTDPTFTDNNVGEMATPKKNQDIADKSYLKDKPGSVKSDLKNLGRFLTGKKETNEEVDESVQTQPSKSADKITTDTLAGRVAGGKLNSFKNYKVDLTTSGTEAVPKEFDNGVDTKEKQKVTTSPGPIDIKMDDKLAKKSTQKEEFEAVEEKVIAGMSGFKKIKGADEKGNVTDKSGAVHTPMSRAKSAAKLSFAKLKQEMLGKISN